MEITKEEEKLFMELSDWVKDEKITDDADPHLLLHFLRGCKYRMDRAKTKYQNYLKLRSSNPEWYDNRDPNLEVLKKLSDLGISLPLPHKDEEDHYTVLARATIHDPKTVPMSDIYRLGLMVFDLWLATNSEISKKGIHVIIDLKGVSFGHVFQMTPFLVQKTVWMWEHCYPLRYASFNFLNCPYFVGFLISIMKNLMTQKLKERVKVHRSYTELHEVINPKYLPEEYGGSGGELKSIKDTWSEKITKNREWFLNDMKKCYLVNEN